MKKANFVLLVIAGAINIGLGFLENGSKLNFLAAALFIFAAFAMYMSDQKKK